MVIIIMAIIGIIRNLYSVTYRVGIINDEGRFVEETSGEVRYSARNDTEAIRRLDEQTGQVVADHHGSFVWPQSFRNVTEGYDFTTSDVEESITLGRNGPRARLSKLA